MELSSVIFVVLALAWAVYLIPQALKHHDEAAAEQLDEGHSERARVLSRRRTSTAAAGSELTAPATAETTATSEEAPAATRRGLATRFRRTRAARPALSSAARAARNRRRVLALLLVTLATVWAFTWFAYLPAITPLWPTLAVVGWLVLARVSVVRAQRARRRRPVAAPEADVQADVQAASAVAPVPAATVAAAGPSLDERPEVVAEQQALADDGALWDPLPLTLPTYVGKATARRTVRTIELTGMTSSGHDEADSALAREAEATQAAPVSETSERRRVAGA